MMGDLNADILKPEINSGKIILNILSAVATTIRKPEATRVTTTSKTCLDIIAIDDDLVCTEYMTGPQAASDHFPVMARIVLSHLEPLKPIVKRSFKNVDFLQF